MAKNNLHDVLRNLGRKETPPDIRRMAEEMAEHLCQDLAQTGPREHAIWREYIMRNRIVQLAAAAVILAVAGVVLYHLGVAPAGASVAWGEVLAKVQAVPIISCKMKFTVDYPQGRQWTDESDVYLGREYGSRMDSYQDGQLHMIKYLVPVRKVIYFVNPQLKRYMEQTLSDEEVAGTMEEQDPRQQVKRILAGAYSQLGRSEIDGVEVEGIEARGSGTQVIRLWVDVKTNWPVRLEAEGQMNNERERRPSHMVLDHFRWDATIDPAIFEPNIPADYTLSGPQ